MDFTWATERGEAKSQTATFIHWNGNKYTNVSCQLTQPTHQKWILTTTRSNNMADFIMTFQTGRDVVSYKYILLIIPLIGTAEVSVANTPEYLRRTAEPTREGDYTIRSMFPPSPTAMFANYATCLSGYAASKAPEMVSVFLAVEGLRVSSDVLNAIKGKTTAQNFLPFIAPFDTRLTKPIQTIGTKEMPFQDFIQVTNQLLNYEHAGKQYKDINRLTREDTLDSYQCVPLDPDRNIQDGKITVDLESGEVLSDVIAEREALRAADATKGSMEPGRLEKYMGSAIGIVLAVIFFSIILYFAWNWLRTATGYSALDGMAVPAAAVTGVGAASAGLSESWAQSLPKYGLLILVGGFGGFLIGAMLS
jgi:hypothetical protein